MVQQSKIDTSTSNSSRLAESEYVQTARIDSPPRTARCSSVQVSSILLQVFTESSCTIPCSMLPPKPNETQSHMHRPGTGTCTKQIPFFSFPFNTSRQHAVAPDLPTWPSGHLPITPSLGTTLSAWIYSIWLLVDVLCHCWFHNAMAQARADKIMNCCKEIYVYQVQ